MDYLFDRRFFIGIGTGLIIATIILSGFQGIKQPMTKAEIEQKAMEYGMDYPDNMKVINEKGVSK